MVKDCWNLTWSSDGLFWSTGQEHRTHGDISEILLNKTNPWKVEMSEWCWNNSCRDRKLEWLRSSEDDLSHEIANSFFLFNVEALKLGGSGDEPVKNEIFARMVWIVNVFFLIILPSDTYTSFCADELFFVWVMTIHMIIRSNIQRTKHYRIWFNNMNMSVSNASNHYESKYNCIICLERVKMPVNCVRCKKLMCFGHVKKILNKCPYCRLEPFQYTTDKYQEELVKLDKKKEQEFLI